MTYTGSVAAASLAGCTGDGTPGGEGTDGSGTSTNSQSDGNVDSGKRPLKWIGPAWAARDGQKNKFTEMTDIDLEITNATIPTTQQKVLSGGRETFDAFSNETSGAGAMVIDNDASYPVATENLDNWNDENVSDLFVKPEERLDYLGEQTETINEILWEDPESKTELKFPPHVYNFDAVGSNPKYVDEVSKWSALFDDKYEGQVAFDGISSIGIPETMMHLLDNDMVDGRIGQLNNPSKDQIDTAVDFLIKQKTAGQFRSTWTSYGNSVNLMASEEAVIGDIWQPAALDVRRAGTPFQYATMSDGIQGYRYWYGGIAPLKPGAEDRNNRAEVESLLDDVHYGAWFPSYIQEWGYSVPQYPNEDLVRDGSDESGEGMGPEYYDWAYRGKATYDSVDDPDLFDPQVYDWSDEEGEPASDGAKRDSGSIEERIDRVGFFQIWPDNSEHMLDRWKEFKSA